MQKRYKNINLSLLFIVLIVYMSQIGCNQQKRHYELASFKLEKHIEDTLCWQLDKAKIEMNKWTRLSDTVVALHGFSNRFIVISVLNILPHPILVISIKDDRIQTVKEFRSKPNMRLIEKYFDEPINNDAMAIQKIIEFLTFIDCFASTSVIIDSVEDISINYFGLNNELLKPLIQPPSVRWQDSTTKVEFFIWHIHDYIERPNQRDAGFKQIDLIFKRNEIISRIKEIP